MILQVFYLLLTYLVISATAMDLLPLIADRSLERRSDSGVGCMFHNTRFDINSRWNPILVPYGVMYCLECQCNAVIKKGQLQQNGQVQCRRISDECPDVSHCSRTPVLPPNSCCKICPDDKGTNNMLQTHGLSNTAQSSSIRIDHQSSQAGENKYIDLNNAAEFSALIMSKETTGRLAAQVHMKYETSVLRIRASLSDNVDGIAFVKMTTRSEEVFRQSYNLSRSTNQICMVSHDAFRFVDELKRGEVTITINISSAQRNRTLVGGVYESQAAILETFSSLSVDEKSSGSATLGLDLRDNSLIIQARIAIDTEYLKASNVGKTRTVIELMRDRRVLYESESVTSVNEEVLTLSSVWADLSTSNMKQLARGRLVTRISIPELNIELEADVRTYLQCGSIVALITGLDAVPSNQNTGVGVAYLTVQPEGSIDYKIELRNIDTKIHEVHIEAEKVFTSEKYRITRLAKDVNNEHQVVRFNGSYDKPDAREIQLLMEGKLFINLAKRNLDSIMRGQLTIIPSVAEQDVVSLMTDPKLPASALTWCRTNSCSLLCEILTPRALVGYDGSTRLFIDYWSDSKLLGSVTSRTTLQVVVSQSDVQTIGSTRPTLRLNTVYGDIFAQATIPNTCFSDKHADELLAGDAPDKPANAWVDPNLARAHKCSYDGQIYSDGESWKPEGENLQCVTCSCKRDRVQCFQTVCPAVYCDNPISLPGECCPACPEPDVDTSKTCFFPGDHREHRYGTLWHPFMHPGGYFKCTVCYCKTDGNNFGCKHLACPTITCPESEQEKLDGECCYTCKATSSVRTDVQVPSSPVDPDTMLGDSDIYNLCRIGDEVYSNGEVFNPKIGPFGSYGNVECKCKDGKVTCKTIKCECHKRSARRNRCCMRECGFTEKDSIQVASPTKLPSILGIDRFICD